MSSFLTNTFYEEISSPLIPYGISSKQPTALKAVAL